MGRQNAAIRPPEGSGQTRGCRKPECLAPASPRLPCWASGLFSAELVRPVPVTWGGHAPEERKIDFFPAATLPNCSARGPPETWLPVRMFVGLNTVHQLTHSSNAMGHHCICMNTFFSLTPGCFRFLGFLFCLFVCFWSSRLTSYKASIHIGVGEAVLRQSVARNSLLLREQLSESHRTWGRG